MIQRDTILDPSQFAAAKKGQAYQVMAVSEGYRLLLNFLEVRTAKALKDVSDCEDGNDRKKLDLLLAWRECGKIFDDIQIEVNRGIESGREAVRELQMEHPEESQVFGFGNDFDE